MKKINILNPKIITFTYIALLILTFTSFIFLYYNGVHKYSTNNSIEYDDNLIDFNVGWFDEYHKPVTLNYFKKNMIFENSTKQTIYHKIPTSVKTGDSICFKLLSLHHNRLSF